MTSVQTVILQIFKEIDSICKKNDILYYAVGGTCIGAIRHGGFIPWDDDLDIAIPIEDYDRFLKIAEKELPNYLYIYSSNDIEHYHYCWAKICDSRTTFLEKRQYCYKDSYKGVFVDIMPISGVPTNRIKREYFIKKLRLLSSLNNIRRFPVLLFYRKVLKVFLRAFPFNTFSKKYINALKKYPFADSEYTGYTWSTNLNKLIFPTSWFAEGQRIPFEDTTINCPLKYHEYLSYQFGDYMTPPPIEKQETHDGIIDLSKSFTYYFDKL